MFTRCRPVAPTEKANSPSAAAWLAVVCACIGTSPADCPPSDLFPSQTYAFTTGELPLRTLTGDFNADGLLDLVVLNLNGNSISKRLGEGDGTFALPQTIALGASPRGGVVADFNADGRDDLAVTMSTGSTHTLVIYYATGNAGTLGNAQPFSLPTHAYDVAAGDLNGDGRLDLVAPQSGSTGSGTVSIFLRNDSGSFHPRQEVFTHHDARSIVLGDFDNDAVLDMIVAHSTAPWPHFHRGVGDGTFLPYVELGSVSGIGTLKAFDFNSDGHLDFIAVRSTFIHPVFYLIAGRGDGTFDSAVSIPLPHGAGTTCSLNDLTGDGSPDLVFADSATNSVSVVPGNPDGTFGLPHTFTVPGEPRFSAIGDFDGDSDLDLAISCMADHATRIFLNDCLFAPKIIGQPQSHTVDESDGATFEVTVAGGTPPLSYQWFKDSTPLVDDDGRIYGAQSPGLTIRPSRTDDTGSYRVVVTSAGGSVTSDWAVLGVVDTCLADVNSDGNLDIFDVIRFLNSYSAGCP